MKILNVFAILGLAAGLAACGSNQNNPNLGYNNGYAYNPTYPGYQTGLPGYQTGPQTPLYQNGQIIGYKSTQPLMSGSQQNGTGNTFQQSAQVNAGDRLRVNLSAATYGVAVAYCDGKLADSIKTGNRSFPLSNLSVSMNGQNLGSGGTFTVPTTGTVTLQAYLNPIQVSCGWLFGNRNAQIMSYFVNLSSGYSYYGASSAVEVERCTNVQGAVMACPY